MPLYIINLGKIIFEKARYLGAGQDLEIETFLNRKSIHKIIKRLDFTSVNTQRTRLYETVKICEKCYEVYNTIRHYKHTFKSNYERLPSRKSVFQTERSCENLVDSTIGKINKDNINDLLVDISAALIEGDAEIDKSTKRNMTVLLSSKTEFSQIKTRNRLKKQHTIHSSRNNLEVKDSKLESMIALRFFPNEKNKIKFKDKDELAQQS